LAPVAEAAYFADKRFPPPDVRRMMAKQVATGMLKGR
jgi:hypothetical protein